MKEMIVRKIFMRALRVGRTAALALGVGVMLALVLGAAATALAGTGVGATFNLGKANSVNKISSLIGSASSAMLKLDNNGTGPALYLEANSGKPPLAVNATAGTATDLSADKLDGQDSTAYQKRVSGECAVGSSIRSIDANGVVTCETDHDSGAAEVGAFREELAASDKQPNDEGDPVSYTKLRDVPTEVVSRDADTLDGKNSSEFAPSSEVHLPQRVTLAPAGSTTLFDTGTFRIIASCEGNTVDGWRAVIKVQTTEALAFFSDSSVTPAYAEFGSSKPAGSTVKVAEERNGQFSNGSFAVVAPGNGEALHVQYTVGGVTPTEASIDVCAFTVSALG